MDIDFYVFQHADFKSNIESYVGGTCDPPENQPALN